MDDWVQEPWDRKPFDTMWQSEKEENERQRNPSAECQYKCTFPLRQQAIGAHPIVMSKMLLPTELDTAMSPMPLRATITLVMRSGMDVPAARIVRPIISSEMPMVSPTCEGKPELRVDKSYSWYRNHLSQHGRFRPQSLTYFQNVIETDLDWIKKNLLIPPAYSLYQSLYKLHNEEGGRWIQALTWCAHHTIR